MDFLKIDVHFHKNDVFILKDIEPTEFVFMLFPFSELEIGVQHPPGHVGVLGRRHRPQQIGIFDGKQWLNTTFVDTVK